MNIFHALILDIKFCFFFFFLFIYSFSCQAFPKIVEFQIILPAAYFSALLICRHHLITLHTAVYPKLKWLSDFWTRSSYTNNGFRPRSLAVWFHPPGLAQRKVKKNGFLISIKCLHLFLSSEKDKRLAIEHVTHIDPSVISLIFLPLGFIIQEGFSFFLLWLFFPPSTVSLWFWQCFSSLL